MITTLIVVDSLSDTHQLHFQNCEVVDFEQYLSQFPKRGEGKMRVINLCATDRYLSKGYYCSLLAEVFSHNKVCTLNEKFVHKSNLE